MKPKKKIKINSLWLWIFNPPILRRHWHQRRSPRWWGVKRFRPGFHWLSKLATKNKEASWFRWQLWGADGNWVEAGFPTCWLSKLNGRIDIILQNLYGWHGRGQSLTVTKYQSLQTLKVLILNLWSIQKDNESNAEHMESKLDSTWDNESHVW